MKTMFDSNIFTYIENMDIYFFTQPKKKIALWKRELYAYTVHSCNRAFYAL